MDERPDELEAAIDRTRGTLGRDLDRLGRRFDVLKDDAAAQAQWWGGMAAVATGALGALLFWPRRRRVRRVYS
jgi:uncharacterized protein DUF3618